MRVHGLDVCAVLDSGARKNVFPLQHYNAINLDVQPTLQPSTITALLGVRPGTVPVLGEAHINRQVSLHFLIADIAGDEALLGHPFLTEAQVLEFGNHRINLFGGEIPYFQAERKMKTDAVRVA